MLAELAVGLSVERAGPVADLAAKVVHVELVLLLAELMVVHAASAVELVDAVPAFELMPAVKSHFPRSGHSKSRICAFLRGPIGAISFKCHRYNL